MMDDQTQNNQADDQTTAQDPVAAPAEPVDPAATETENTQEASTASTEEPTAGEENQ